MIVKYGATLCQVAKLTGKQMYEICAADAPQENCRSLTVRGVKK